MFLYLPAIFQGILFVLSLGLLSFYGDFFWFFFGVFFIVSIVGFRFAAKRWSFWYLLILFLFSVWVIVNFIDIDKYRQIFIFASSVIYYFLILGVYRVKRNPKDQTARGIMSMVLMATIFLFFSASYGAYLNFEAPVWFLMIFYFVNIWLVSYQYFVSIEGRDKVVVLIYSFMLGFAILEMGWIINFWPFSYLTTGFILFMFYYVLWDLVQSYFFNNLSRKKVFFNLLFFVIISSVILFSSTWLPVI